jgi:HrpA-like RNA helicase
MSSKSLSEDIGTQAFSERHSETDETHQCKKAKTDPSPLQLRKSQLAKARQGLPVYKFKKRISDLLQQNDVLLVVAETGESVSYIIILIYSFHHSFASPV